MQTKTLISSCYRRASFGYGIRTKLNQADYLSLLLRCWAICHHMLHFCTDEGKRVLDFRAILLPRHELPGLPASIWRKLEAPDQATAMGRTRAKLIQTWAGADSVGCEIGAVSANHADEKRWSIQPVLLSQETGRTVRLAFGRAGQMQEPDCLPVRDAGQSGR